MLVTESAGSTPWYYVGNLAVGYATHGSKPIACIRASMSDGAGESM